MERKSIICTICPVSCNIIILEKEGLIESIEGYDCKKGEEHARNEYINPVRILTSTVKLEKGKNPLVPVRSNKPIPKHLIFKCMKEIRNLKVNAPIKQYDILIPNILGTGIDIISTSSVE